MSNPYYGGAPNAFAGGMEFGAMQRRRRLNENALNALIAQYGPEAADPASTAAMQTIAQRAATNPLELADAQRVDAARRAAVESQGAIAGDPVAQQRGFDIEDRNRGFQTQAMQRAAAVLKYAKENNKDLGAAFDMVQGVLPSIGIPTEKLAEARQKILTDPDSVDELVALMLGLPDPSKGGAASRPISVWDNAAKKWKLIQPMKDGSYRELTDLEAAQTVQGNRRLDQGDVRLGLTERNITRQELEDMGFKAAPGMQYTWSGEPGNSQIIASPVPGTEQEADTEKKHIDLETTDRKFLQNAGTVAANSEIVGLNVSRALPYFTDAKAGVLMQNLRSGMKLIAGSDAANAEDAIKEIKNKVSIDALQQMRASSPTGGAMGNVSDRDIELLQSALGRLETNRDPQRMVEDLNYITKEYNRIVGLARQDAVRAQARLKQREQRPQPRFTVPAQGAEPSLDELLNKYAPTP